LEDPVKSNTQADAMRQTPELYRVARLGALMASLTVEQVRALGLDQPDIQGVYEVLCNLQYARERMMGAEQIIRILLLHYQAALLVLSERFDAEQAASAIRGCLRHEDDRLQAIEVDELCDPQWIAAVTARSHDVEKAGLCDGA
jgi:hypothetical protein